MSDKRLERPENLPAWASPPLDEVAIAVQFNDIAGFKIEHFGLLAARMRAAGFPVTQDKAPIPPSFELFGKSVPAQPQIQFSTVEVPFPRVWYISEDSHRLVQVQQDRFIYNWRKVAGRGEYPRLSVVFPEFQARFGEFSEFLRQNELPSPSVNQCEVSYFNLIHLKPDESYHGAYARVFREPPMAPTSVASITPETIRVASTYLLNRSDASPAARIHVTAQSAVRERQRVIQLTLVFRGPWSSDAKDGSESLVEFIERGREAVVQVFDSIVSDQVHVEWGRYTKNAQGGAP